MSVMLTARGALDGGSVQLALRGVHARHGAAGLMHTEIRPPLDETPMNCLRGIALVALSASGLQALAASGAPVAPCTARSFEFDRKEVGWKHQPLSKLKRDTDYKVARVEGRAVMRASADRSASLLVAAVKPAMAVPTTLSWDWKTDALVPGADNRDKAREDAPLRVLVAFDGDIATLPEDEQKRFKRAKNLTGRQPPYAVVMYIWSDQVPVGSVIASAHTSQVKMLAVASGKGGLGSWQSVQRNLSEDYRRAYGAEPGPVLGVAVMTDTDNTGTKAVGEYADIRLTCAGG
jgi:hypothetical protein